MELRIFKYNKKLRERFKKESGRISKIIKGCEIHHIGSTSVPGLGGKGILDIMIGIKNWKEAGEIINKLKEIGFTHIHPKEKGKIFLSKNTSLSLSNVHIHIVLKQSKEYKQLLFFRDYLRNNKKELKRYYDLKLGCQKESKGNRNEYGKLKEKYIKEILKLRNLSKVKARSKSILKKD